MRIPRTAGTVFLFLMLGIPLAFANTAVKGSSEDLYWSDPMTVHDYKNKNDLHSIALSAAAITELEFVRLGDALIDLTTRNHKSPISRSLDSMEYAYSKLPRIEPVRRFGQLFNALQLRQISLSDARLIGSLLNGSVGGVTPVMQSRVYNVIVCLEDVIYDLDRTIMAPLNRGISSLRKKSTQVKSLGYVADGIGVLRWEISSDIKFINKKVAGFFSNVVTDVEKTHDAEIRHKRKKSEKHLLVYAKMPLSVFQENRAHFTGKKARAAAGTLAEWNQKLLTNPELLPKDIQKADIRLPPGLLNTASSQEIILAVEYDTWDKIPRSLKKYVITSDEFAELVRTGVPATLPAVP